MSSFGSALSVALATTVLSTAASAAGNHEGSHYTFGEPGVESEVIRTVEVTATDDMKFTMDLGSIRQGETIEFVVTNVGQIPHEFSIGDTGSQRAHAEMMRQHPHMGHHHDPAALTLAPGETKSLVWNFNEPVQGEIVFGCHLPGHWDAGMSYRAAFERANTSGA
jgi:uncharacterized cupredoxin-like copper-binding protein